MIIAIIGNVGSGKSLSATKLILSSHFPSFCNFKLHNKKAIRIRKKDVVCETVTGYTKTGKEQKEMKVNWEFWNEALKKYKNYHIVLDEVHNIVHSRQSMTKNNVLMSVWISQIRKILGNSEKTHIVLISQRINRIDIAFRDLLHEIVYCEKIVTGKKIRTQVIENGVVVEKLIPETWIVQHHFSGENCVNKYLAFREGAKTYDFRSGFVGNDYFKFYDSYEIFGETAYL